ncbi:MAG: cysteine--tRNA ligase [Verrucomicrobiales bacterium]|nr:cysteine--tRNA ligase [Verrucomicrobiales bacterium]
MALKLFNTLSRSVQEFAPLNPAGKKVGMYCCGPTVYDFAHIGNWRTFVFADLVRRVLEFSGYDVQHVMNITDIEDKIIKRVNSLKSSSDEAIKRSDAQSLQHSIASTLQPLRDFTGKFETAFLDDLKALGCREPHVKPRATEYIAEIIALIEKLIARGVAYKAADGSVYFSITKYQGCGCHYGQLLKLNFDEMRAGERVSSDEYEKESVADFALWKARVPDDGDIFWPSPFGEGRPGWHIECSAMSMKVLGESFDLHLGGEDLKFPHHEDEIAQSEGATGKPFVKYWLHGAHLLVEGKKMSKSLENYFTLRDLLAKGFTGREVRYLLLTAHYRETFNFTLDGLHGAKSALARIDECVGKLREVGAPASGPARTASQLAGSETGVPLLANFTAAISDDLNISAAWGAVFEWVRETNKKLAENTLSSTDAAVNLAAWEKIDSVLGISVKTETEIPAEILALAEARTDAKKAKDFKRADAIRDELKAKGWVIEDSPKGIKLKKCEQGIIHQL